MEAFACCASWALMGMMGIVGIVCIMGIMGIVGIVCIMGIVASAFHLLIDQTLIEHVILLP